MLVEEEIFKKTKVDLKKIVKYGFKKEGPLYKYSKNIINDSFRVDVEINSEGQVKAKVFDLSFLEEYTNYRIEKSTGSFVSRVREELKNILKDIKDKCFIKKFFISLQANRIANKIFEEYGDEPNFEWEKFPGYATFRNKDSKKWYGIIMNINKNKLDEKSKEEVEIIDIKLNPKKIENLLKRKGFYPAYHMNKKSWITIVLNNTIADTLIMDLIKESYLYTVINKNSINEWIVPANPKYFDIEEALKENNTIIWKQSTDIKVNDIVYLYVGEPYSAIMYKFKVIKVNIPYEYIDENLKIKKAMKIKLMKRYQKGALSFKKLKEFGINAVRGPRYMPLTLSKYIDKIKNK